MSQQIKLSRRKENAICTRNEILRLLKAQLFCNKNADRNDRTLARRMLYGEIKTTSRWRTRLSHDVKMHRKGLWWKLDNYYRKTTLQICNHPFIFLRKENAHLKQTSHYYSNQKPFFFSTSV